MHFSSHLEKLDERNCWLHGDGAGEYGNGFILARRAKTSGFNSASGRGLQKISNILETSETQITLRELPIGARLLIRSKTDWRVAVVSQFYEEKATLIVCSPSGRTYRLRRLIEMEIVYDGKIPILKCDSEDCWRDNFTKYDVRW